MTDLFFNNENKVIGIDLKKTKKLVIIAGGKGTRLGLTDIPKSMVKVNGKPILEYQIELAKKYGFNEIFILTGYLANVIYNYIGNGEKYGIKINHIVEPYPMGCGGCLNLIKNFIGRDESFIVVHGDVLLNVNLGKLYNYHCQSSGTATVMVYPTDHYKDSNLVEVNEAGKITKFNLKPHKDNESLRNIAVRSIFAFSGKIFEKMSDKIPIDLDKEILPELLEKGEPVFGYYSGEYIKDVGTPERLLIAQKDFEEGLIVLNIENIPKKAIFLDRDGVINKYIENLFRVEDFELLDGVTEAIGKINKKHSLAVLTTNQPSIAKGFLTFEGLEDIHKKMDTLLAGNNAFIDRIYFCPHHPEKGFSGEVPELKIDCDCRKPKPGMILKAANDFNIDLAKSWVIGDNERDMIAGKTAGCRTILLNQNNEKNQYADLVFPDLLSAVNCILKDEEKNETKEKIKVPFGTISISDKAKELVNEALNSGRVSQGKYVREFEKKFAQIVGVKEAVAVSSGTDADTLALAVLYDFGAHRGDEIIVPALSFVATGNAVINAGFTPIFVDVKKETLNIDVDKIEQAITYKTKAIMPVHLMGKPADMDSINEIALKHRLVVIEDAAEAHGAVYKGRNAGGLGDMGAFSLYLAHIISTVEGGIITTNNSSYAEILRSLRSHGRACKCEQCVLNTASGYCPKRFVNGEDIRFIFERIGYSCKMNELEAAVGLGNLEIYYEILEKRRENLKKFTNGLQKYSKYFYTIKEEANEKIGPHAFGIILKENIGFSRNELVKYLEENNIETRTLFSSMPTQCEGFKYLGYNYGDFVNAEYVGNKGLHIGVHQEINDEQVEYFFNTLDQFLNFC